MSANDRFGKQALSRGRNPPETTAPRGLAALRGWRLCEGGSPPPEMVAPRGLATPGERGAPWGDRALGRKAVQKAGCAMHDRLFDHFSIPRLTWYFTVFPQLTAGAQKGGCAAFYFERRTLESTPLRLGGLGRQMRRGSKLNRSSVGTKGLTSRHFFRQASAHRLHCTQSAAENSR